MAITEKRSETGAHAKSNLAQSDDEQTRRVFLLVLLTLLLTFIIVPKGVLTPSDFAVGDIAPRDIKAPRALLIPDDELTSKKRDETEKAVLSLYDFDPLAGSVIAEKIGQVLAYIDSEAATEQGKAELLSGLATDFGLQFDKQDLSALLALSEQPALVSRLKLLLNRAYRQKVVGNLKLFSGDRSRGVNYRNLETQNEALDDKSETVIGLGELQDRIRQELAGEGFAKDQQAALQKLIMPLLRPNTSYNQNETEARRQAARQEVQPVLVQVKKGEMIVREGDRITPDHLKKIEVVNHENAGGSFAVNALGLFVCTLLMIFIGHRFGYQNVRKYRTDMRDLVFLASTFLGQTLVLKIGIFISTALGTAFPYIDQVAYYYIFPFAVGAMLVRIVLNSEIALVFAMMSAVLAGFLFGNSFTMMVFAFLSSVAGAHWVRHIMERSNLFRAGMRVGMFNFVLILALHLLTAKTLDLQLLYKLCFGLTGGMVAAIMVTGIVPLVESLFRYTTNIKLLELANMNNPVLRDLMIQAPGTYHHSIIVGNLAEAAAEKINANPLMARVAAYYHDIGKIRKPLYFIENIGSQENRHDKLSPSMSALILMAHLKDGVEMARECRLGQNLIDIIRQHHGTSLMKFFYDKAKNISDPGVQHIDERDYRYPGPKPQSREAALIMLADAVEAASRTLTDPTPARIQGMVQKIINNIFIDGQLDECELTLKDLHHIAKSFNGILAGIFHHRVDYPEPVSKGRSLEKVQKEKATKKNAEDRDRKSAKNGQDQEGPLKKGSAEDLKRLGMS